MPLFTYGRHRGYYNNMYHFKTTEEAENYFWEKLAKHNEDFTGRDRFLEEAMNNGDIIENEDLEVDKGTEQVRLDNKKYV